MSKPQVKFARQRSPSALSLALSLSMGLALVSAALPSLAQSVQGLSSEQLVRTRNNVTLRSSPDSVGRIVMMLPPQTALEILPGRFGPWLQVRTAQGVVGWLQSLDVNATTRPTASFIRPAPDPVSPAPIKGTVRSDRALDTMRAVNAAENAPSKVTSAISPSPALASSLSDKASEGMAAVVTITATATVPAAPPLPADDSVSRARRRLVEAETYRTTSEDARKFAFNAGLERVRLISALSMFNATVPNAEPVNTTNTTDATTNGKALALLANTALSNNISMQVYINRLGRWLSLESTQPDLLWTFAVMDSDESKAYGLPGGYVLITQGLLNTLSTETELASVLAHEIARVTLGHPAQALSSDDELAADRSAVLLLARSGFNPDAVVSTVKMTNTRAQGKTLWASLIGPDALTQQRLAGLKVFMGTRFEELSSKFNQPGIRIAQRLSEINTPDNLSDAVPATVAQALQPVLQPVRPGTGKPLLDAQVKGAALPIR